MDSSQCIQCEINSPQFTCSGCSGVEYCSSKCQRDHWDEHVGICFNIDNPNVEQLKSIIQKMDEPESQEIVDILNVHPDNTVAIETAIDHIFENHNLIGTKTKAQYKAKKKAKKQAKKERKSKRGVVKKVVHAVAKKAAKATK